MRNFFTFCYSLKRFYYYTEGINTPASGAKGIRRQIRQRGSAPPPHLTGAQPQTFALLAQYSGSATALSRHPGQGIASQTDPVSVSVSSTLADDVRCPTRVIFTAGVPNDCPGEFA